MNAPLRTYRPSAAGTQNHRSSATTRVAPFAHLHISSFANTIPHSTFHTPNSLHSSNLSVWLSVDPMSGKYPSLSPYVYCADNPVKLVDPNGEEFGDFYDFHGNYLGNDGNTDDVVYLVDGEATNDVSKNETNDPNKIKYSQKTTYGDINKALEIFDMPNGQKEEGGAFDNNGEWHQGKGYSDHVNLPISNGKTTIHRHTWGKPDECYGDYRSPENPSATDLESFKNFEQNIIVGKSKGTYDPFYGFQNRKDIISFYGSIEKTPNCTINRDAAQKIVERGKKIGRIN